MARWAPARIGSTCTWQMEIMPSESTRQSCPTGVVYWCRQQCSGESFHAATTIHLHGFILFSQTALMQDDVSAPAPAPDLMLAGGRHVLASAAMLGGVTALVKLVAFVKDLMVARRFGTGDELDAFLVAFMLPSYAVSVLATSFASAFVPTYIRVWQKQGPAAAARLVGAALAAGLALLTIVTLLLAATNGYLLPLVGIGFDEAKLDLAQRLFYPLLGILLASGASAVFAAVLNAHERFAIAALAPVAIPLTTAVAFW